MFRWNGPHGDPADGGVWCTFPGNIYTLHQHNLTQIYWGSLMTIICCVCCLLTLTPVSGQQLWLVSVLWTWLCLCSATWAAWTCTIGSCSDSNQRLYLEIFILLLGILKNNVKFQSFLGKNSKTIVSSFKSFNLHSNLHQFILIVKIFILREKLVLQNSLKKTKRFCSFSTFGDSEVDEFPLLIILVSLLPIALDKLTRAVAVSPDIWALGQWKRQWKIIF